MSFWDNVKKFTQPYADDEYDDEYDDGADAGSYDTDDQDTAPRYSRPDSEPAEEHSAFDFGLDSDVTPAAPASSSGFSGQVVSVGSSGSKQQVILFRPNNFNDTSKAADDLRSKKAVIVNMEGVDKAMARRVVDFLSGCAYSLDGTVKKIASCTYLFCPFNMDIVGDLDNLQGEVENYV